MAAARAEWESRDTLDVLNHDIPRVDGPEKVSGLARYTHDIRLPRMVYARLVVCPYPRATLRSLSFRKANRIDGVVHTEAIKQEGDAIAYQGYDGVVGIVLGETPEAAGEGLAVVDVDYDRLAPPLVTPEQSLAAGAPELRSGGNARGESSSGDADDVQAELESADFVVDETYTLAVQHHVCLETHGVVASVLADEATIYHSNQFVSGDAREFARLLELPNDAIHIITDHVGGGFGSKFGAGVEGLLAARLSRDLERPVHLMLSRRDEFLMAGNRSGSVQRLKGGANADGTLVALHADADRIGGMGNGSLPTPPYIYTVGESFARVRSVLTATDPSRAMRAPGHPQASFGMESLVDELAAGLALDPVEMRKRNLSDEAWHRQLDRVASEIGWHRHPNRTRHGSPDADGMAFGIGFGVSVWGSGSMPITICEVRISADGSISASTATQDIGQGSRTLVAAIVAEEFGLSPTDINERIGDNRLPPSVYSGGSITTGSLAPAVKHGAHLAREALSERVAASLACEPDDLVWSAGSVHVGGNSSRSLTWKQACALLGSETISVNGHWQAHLADQGVHGAQAASVTVDTLTGRVQVVKMVCIQDQGLPLNRMALRSQINGGMIGALSYALLEERVHDEASGLLLTDDMDSYRIAGCQEMPEMVAIIDDDDTRTGVMGMAEATAIPGASAIANAVYNACGLRLRSLPLTPDRVLTGLAAMG
jgi:xanthine dehydrogenase YagR molybdenum-binding subunit